MGELEEMEIEEEEGREWSWIKSGWLNRARGERDDG